ncbi:unnamed protein product [Gulo gulo]|uniref:Uncharacterized protein n=1 Tax=Gulo gulo TaxID=48420 RepID=A0A9X9M1R8_GULGU|nr:unnamed protein product [Gulo gulo]
MDGSKKMADKLAMGKIPSFHKAKQKKTETRIPCRPKKPLSRRSGMKFPKNLEDSPAPSSLRHSSHDMDKEPPARWTRVSDKLHCEPGHSVPMLLTCGSLRRPLIGLPNSPVCPGIVQQVICMINEKNTYFVAKKDTYIQKSPTKLRILIR